jgi:hypothetical protein
VVHFCTVPRVQPARVQFGTYTVRNCIMRLPGRRMMQKRTVPPSMPQLTFARA